jgi:hypothetical protein
MFKRFYNIAGGPGISVGIATEYGLEVPGSTPGGDEIFRPPRPVLGPTQPTVNWVPGLSPGGKVRPGCAADHSPSSSAAVMEQYSYTSTHPVGHTGPVTGSLYLHLSLKYQISYKSVLWVPRYSIRTDRHDEANSHCSRICERVENSCDGRSATSFLILLKQYRMFGLRMK